ncbi:MAG TPA: carboxypeptidase-like regulatory domain-containing protein [Vicinamibacterales bacterium]
MKRCALAIVAAALASGCKPGSSAPTSPGLTSSIVVSLDGPASVAPGGVLRYRALATQFGVSQDVTAGAAWTSDSPDVLRSTAPGTYLAASSLGETNIRVTYLKMAALAHVYVLDTGTFAVRGIVRDGSIATPGAHITVVAGAAAGLSAVTSNIGAFELLGVGGTDTLTVTLDGYQPATTTLNISAAATVDFTLQPAGPRPDVSGAWLLTFMASPACPILPDEARLRTYPIIVGQSGPALTLKFTLPQSAWSSSEFTVNGLLFGSRMTFVLSNDDPLIYQTLSSGEKFTLDGAATLDLSAGTFRGQLNGMVHVFLEPNFTGTSCTRSDHALLMARSANGG